MYIDTYINIYIHIYILNAASSASYVWDNWDIYAHLMYMYAEHTQHGLNISPLKSYTATATHCNTLQHTATHCHTLQHTATHCNTLQHTATQYRTLPHSTKLYRTLKHRTHHCNTALKSYFSSLHCKILQHCNSLQHTATNCTPPTKLYTAELPLQVSTTLCQTLQHTAPHCNTPLHTATHQWNPILLSCRCNSLQHSSKTATHCNTLQHTATHQWNPILLSCCCRENVILPALYSSLCFRTLHVQKTKCINKYVSIFENANPHDIWFTGWRRCIGCLKLQVSFRKRATKYRSLLRKMTYQDKASCGSSPPCTSFSWTFMFPQKSH